ncbi:MAG: 4Fe-4S dicluster domain-containing protein, partial [Fidelibacterota bacterium]
MASLKNPLIMMKEDINRSLRKRVKDREWAMVVDTRKCVGCHACTVSCKAENVTPPGVDYRNVPEVETGEYPEVERYFMPRNCMQCKNPPCLKACPQSAIYIRADGIVGIDYRRCKNCEGEAIQACPYDALFHDDGSFYTDGMPGGIQQYEFSFAYDYNSEWTRRGGKTPVGSCRKCHFCLHRLEKGLLPACVGTCIGQAMYFGDLKDPDSLISGLLKTGRWIRLEKGLSTAPHVY